MSSAVIDALRRPPGAAPRCNLGAGDPLDDDDLHLALYVCYELHYRGWDGVDAEWEWDPGLLALRAGLERGFLAALRAALPPTEPIHRSAVVPGLRALLNGASGPSVSAYAERDATVEQLRELAIHRSAYQLKEADPHTWALPRLPAGAAKSAMLGLQMDEYGNGEPGRSHAELFAATMRALDLDPRYGYYLDEIPGVVLATVNLLSLFGLHRRWAAACVG
ncbi:MAG: iron-containing redox enzyme family protein, partial [Acidimicrobiales bacterium]